MCSGLTGQKSCVDVQYVEYCALISHLTASYLWLTGTKRGGHTRLQRLVRLSLCLLLPGVLGTWHTQQQA